MYGYSPHFRPGLLIQLHKKESWDVEFGDLADQVTEPRKVRSDDLASETIQFNVPRLFLVDLCPECCVWVCWMGYHIKCLITAAVRSDRIVYRLDMGQAAKRTHIKIYW
jgi:hypothetical protein